MAYMVGGARAAEAESVRAASDLPVLSPWESLRKARVDGKYAMLLRQISVPQDARQYDEFRDLGKQTRTQYAGHSGLPAGFWVYVHPHWYIWRDSRSAAVPKRPWGPEQVCGPPDTPNPGDQATAWASQIQDNQEEWLTLEYAEPVLPSSISVHETYNPGALHRVTAFRLDGREVEVWKGKDPTPIGAAQGVSKVPLNLDFKTNRIRIYLDSAAVPGWNEIDAVGLHDAEGGVQWAAAVEASSTYAQQNNQIVMVNGGKVVVVQGGVAPLAPPAPAPLPAQPRPDPNLARIRLLEREIAELKRKLEEQRRELERARQPERRPR